MANKVYNWFSKKYSLLPSSDNVGSYVQYENGVRHYYLTSAITDGQSVNVPVGSYAITSHSSAIGKIFVAKNISGVKWKEVNTGEGSGGSDYVSPYVPLIIITGESNSGGYALNSELTNDKLIARPSVQILNNNTFQFEDLDIGTNNLIDHAGLGSTDTHGFENEIANSVEASNWNTDVLYLIKTGQGASKIEDWEVGGTYWTKFVQRVDEGLNIINNMGKIPVIYIFYSQGINDAIANTNIETWKEATLNHFKKIRSYLGFVPIIMTKFMSNYSSYNSAIDDLSQESGNYSVVTSDASLRDANHWDSDGMDLVADRMITLSLQTVGQDEFYSNWQQKALYNYIIQNPTPPSGGGGGGSLLTPGPIVWDVIAPLTEDGTYLINPTGASNVGSASLGTIDATSAFEVIVEYPLDPSETNATVIYLDTNNTANYTWASGLDFIAGVYQFEGNFYRPVGGYDATNFTGVSGLPNYVKMRKSGNDLIYSSSTNGTDYTDRHTVTDALLGITDIYVKGLFAAGNAQNKIKVTLAL